MNTNKDIQKAAEERYNADLIDEARELITKLLPPERFGEDYDADRLWNIIEEMHRYAIAGTQWKGEEVEDELWHEVSKLAVRTKYLLDVSVSDKGIHVVDIPKLISELKSKYHITRK